MSKRIGKRSFLELKLQFSFKKNLGLSKFKFSCGPFCQRYALYGITNCRIVDINFNNAQFWSSSSHGECLVLSLWGKESNKRLAADRVSQVRKSRGKRRGVRVKGRVRIRFLCVLWWRFPRAVDQGPGCSDNCIQLWKKEHLFELGPPVMESQGLQAKGVLLELIVFSDTILNKTKGDGNLLSS